MYILAETLASCCRMYLLLQNQWRMQIFGISNDFKRNKLVPPVSVTLLKFTDNTIGKQWNGGGRHGDCSDTIDGPYGAPPLLCHQQSSEVKRLGILLADLAAPVVGLLEPVARHLQLLGPDVKNRRRLCAQLAFQQCCLLQHHVVHLLFGRDDGLSRRVHGQAGVHRGAPASLPRLDTKASILEGA
uniref:Y1 n=1 Tax=Arundo donax TaxID=35708 RepID=A0A0A9CUH4_ARUDO